MMLPKKLSFGVGEIFVHEFSNHHRPGVVMERLESGPDVINARPDGILFADSASYWSFVITLQFAKGCSGHEKLLTKPDC